ncbi:CinA family protein [Actinomyces sp. 186855]|uniref:CinA family protein n=1 Tax=unclassified Actinomyces TaxID=2609248 RepID=UPI0020304FFA|nr:CinA family protein [Actinomyces sp. 217892]MCL3776731.1 CinA family protein [Actinomyces sp. AC-20-1]MCL3790418.1 CinA family protein [Actinomyces sp. 187325]MCL3792045.1 CinA family protein [Actinomyces sp. 186855]MCL3795047.1 CinA family protein [Actinomyces sp. 217892]
MSPVGGPGGLLRRAEHLLVAARERGLTLAVAESLTGGVVCSTLVGVPGASTVLLGGVVAYATRVKAEVLGVDAGLLARTGPVDGEVALQMARGAARVLGADLGLATTGVAGPGPADGHEAGTVHVAVVTPWGEAERGLRLDGDRQRVRLGAAEAVVGLALETLRAPRPR